MNLTGVLDLKKYTNFNKRTNLIKTHINNKFVSSLNDMNKISTKLIDYEKRLIILDKKVKKKSIDLGTNIALKLKSFKKEENEIKKEITKISSKTENFSNLKNKCFFGIKLILENRLIKLKYTYKKLKLKNKNHSKKSKERKKFLQNRNLNYTFKREENTERNEIKNSEKNKIEINALIIKENNQQNIQLNNINNTLDKFVSSFKKLSEIVQHHDQMVCDIEYNTVQTQDNVKKGKNILINIFHDVNSNRKFILKFFAILILIVVFYLLFV